MTAVRRSRRVLLAASCLLLACLPVGGAAAAEERPSLPAPSGPYRVGTSAFHLVDQARSDPWCPAGPAN